ncbi:MazG family protein [Microlunatus endophyticus]|nr:MazG family protein [Microlunatus endophyticus]
MGRLRAECPWDAQQTHRSLVQYLIEETYEVVEAIEGTRDGGETPIPAHDHLREELGDLLFQIVFHTAIAQETDPDFTLAAVAAGVADKLIARHPYVFGTEAVPEDLDGSWENRKAAEKGRRSVLEGIPDQLSSIARANKIISRARSRAVPAELPVPDEPAGSPLDARTVGDQLISLIARAQAGGIDADQAARDAVRRLERQVTEAEADR